MLQNYLEGLVKEANVKAEESAISVLPFDELAKLADVKGHVNLIFNRKETL